jgi:hypothetical protein
MGAVMTSRQAAELDHAFERNGYTAENVKKLSEGNILGDFLAVLLGHAEIKSIEHFINCDADPFIPGGWKVEEHKKGGQLKWDPKKVSLYLPKRQQNGKVIGGNELREELKDQPVLNANVLDYLLANPHLIPEEWKNKYVFFWGTIYRDSHGNLYVPLERQQVGLALPLARPRLARRQSRGVARKLVLRPLFLGSSDPWNFVLGTQKFLRKEVIRLCAKSGQSLSFLLK